MASNEYHFITHWRFRERIEDVADVIEDVAGFPRWWPAVYIAVTILVDGAKHGLGSVAELHSKGWLPYTIRWQSTCVAEDYPNGSTIEAAGDFVGRGVWTLAQNGEWTDVSYDWRIRAEKPLLKALTPLLRPIFRANHHWAMATGQESVRLEILRRRASSDAERAAIPAPPPPTFRRRQPAR